MHHKTIGERLQKMTNHLIVADESLLCNGIRNCKFGWDEETCSSGEGGGIPVDFSKTENIVIVLILIAIMIGMCTGMIYNLVRKLSEDKEDVLASREKVGFGLKNDFLIYRWLPYIYFSLVIV